MNKKTRVTSNKTAPLKAKLPQFLDPSLVLQRMSKVNTLALICALIGLSLVCASVWHPGDLRQTHLSLVQKTIEPGETHPIGCGGKCPQNGQYFELKPGIALIFQIHVVKSVMGLQDGNLTLQFRSFVDNSTLGPKQLLNDSSESIITLESSNYKIVYLLVTNTFPTEVLLEVDVSAEGVDHYLLFLAIGWVLLGVGTQVVAWLARRPNHPQPQIRLLLSYYLGSFKAILLWIPVYVYLVPTPFTHFMYRYSWTEDGLPLSVFRPQFIPMVFLIIVMALVVTLWIQNHRSFEKSRLILSLPLSRGQLYVTSTMVPLISVVVPLLLLNATFLAYQHISIPSKTSTTAFIDILFTILLLACGPLLFAIFISHLPFHLLTRLTLQILLLGVLGTQVDPFTDMFAYAKYLERWDHLNPMSVEPLIFFLVIALLLCLAQGMYEGRKQYLERPSLE